MTILMNTSDHKPTSSMYEFCDMAHMGDYVRQKILDTGRNKKWFAEQIGISRTWFNENLLQEAIWSDEQIQIVKDKIDPHFFDDFKGEIPQVNHSKEDPSVYQVQSKGTKFKFTIEVDPEDFEESTWLTITKDAAQFLKKVKQTLKDS